jgi:HK97 family phage portal protein
MVLLDKIKTFFTVKQEASVSKKGVTIEMDSDSKKYYGFRNVFWGLGKLFGVEFTDKEFIKNYKSNSDLFSIVDKIVTTSASIPYHLYKKNKDKWELVDDKKNALYNLLQKPNKDQTQKEYVYEKILLYVLTGRSIELKQKPIGFGTISALYNLPSQFTEVFYKDTSFFSEIDYFQFCYNTVQRFAKEDIIFLEKLNPEYNECAFSPINASALSISTSNQIALAQKSLIENKGAVGLVSSGETGGFSISHEDKEELDQFLKEDIGGASKYGAILTSRGNLKYTQIGQLVKDLMLDKFDTMMLRKICNILGVSSQIFNDPENKTYNNLAEAKESLYTETCIPLAQNFVDSWNENLIPIFNKLDNTEYYIELDLSRIPVMQEKEKMKQEMRKLMLESITALSEKVKMGTMDRQKAINILANVYNIPTQEAELYL